MQDLVIGAIDGALRTLFGTPRPTRPRPHAEETHLGQQEKSRAAAMMRVNHVGEMCAQALYAAQALATASPELKQQFRHAALEEADHLAWTQARLRELGARPSLLNPVWYMGAFCIGVLAGRMGDRVSLGFLVETERQVEAHLQDHLDRLPAEDHASRAIVEKMKDDESQHAMQALAAGAAELPAPARLAMKAAAKVMTTTAHYI